MAILFSAIIALSSLGEPPLDAPSRDAAALFRVLFSAYGVLDASWEAAAHRGTELDEALAGYAFDVGDIRFANAWLPLASFAAAAGWVVLSTAVLTTWTGWLAVCGGAGLLVARFFWQVGDLWILPYGLVWLWVIVTCVYLIRRRAAAPSAT